MLLKLKSFFLNIFLELFTFKPFNHVDHIDDYDYYTTIVSTQNPLGTYVPSSCQNHLDDLINNRYCDSKIYFNFFLFFVEI